MTTPHSTNEYTSSSAGSGEILILDDLIRQRAADSDQTPLLAFPKFERGITDYEKFTGQDLDRFIDQAAKYYVHCGLEPANGTIVALLGLTDLAYVVTFFALSRLGYTSLCLSNRLAPSAYIALLDETGCDVVVPGRSKQVTALIAQVQQERLVKSVPIVRREDFDRLALDEPPISRVDVDPLSVVTILHSSGSTGLPKSIYLTHKRLMTKTPPSKGAVEFTTFPWFHGYGNWVGVHGMYARKLVYVYNANLPVTADYMIKVLGHIRPDNLHVVPYSLKLLGETQSGINTLKACSRVLFSGSGCSDVLGNRLTGKGINLETFWGATEIGGLGNSFGRPKGDDSWDYVRILPPIRPYLWMKPLEDGTYEAIYLKGLPTLVASNSDDPPLSFHSKDLFIPHAIIPYAWKHVGRLDDRLTLTNGEKVLPLPIEGRVNEDPLIKEAVVFGAGKSMPGLLVFRSEAARYMSDTEFIDAIWPTVQNANAHAESFSQLSKETIIPLPAGIDFPRTDKDSIKRAQVYRVFSNVIENMYTRLDDHETGTQKFNLHQMKRYLMQTFDQRLGIKLQSIDDDFFAAGVDSLQAIQMRALILKELDLGGSGKRLGQNVVFDTSNVARLAKHLCALRSDFKTLDEDEIETMTAMIKKYSAFKTHVPGSASSSNGHVVVLTGATGSLGARILAQLLNRSDIHKVYCLSRGKDPLSRILQGLQQRNLTIPSIPKLIALTSDLSLEDLGISQTILQGMLSQTTVIIHSAWAVNFMLGIRSFEDQHIRGVQNLINFSLSVSTPNPARFYFCSSISVALATSSPAIVPESATENLHAALPMGYSRSKLVAEHIVRNAAVQAGAPAHVLRIGQIVGDSREGLWNDTEAIPLMVRSALTLKALPALHETCSWLPVDHLATTMLSLTLPNTSFSSSTHQFYNLTNPHTFSWTDSLLPALRAAGLEFTTVPISTWLQKLREAAPTDDVKLNPALKLVEYFERMYAEDGDMTQKGELSFDTNKAQQHSRLGEAPRIIEDGFVEKFLSQWMKKWEEKAQETPKRFVEDEDHSQGAESVEYTSAPEIPDEPTEKRKRQAEVHAPVDGLPLAKRSMMAAVNGKGH